MCFEMKQEKKKKPRTSHFFSIDSLNIPLCVRRIFAPVQHMCVAFFLHPIHLHRFSTALIYTNITTVFFFFKIMHEANIDIFVRCRQCSIIVWQIVQCVNAKNLKQKKSMKAKIRLQWACAAEPSYTYAIVSTIQSIMGW